MIKNSIHIFQLDIHVRTNIFFTKERWDIIDDHFHFDNTIRAIEKRFVSRELEQFPQHCSLSSEPAIYFTLLEPNLPPPSFFEDVRYFSKRFPVIPGGRPPAILSISLYPRNQVRRRFLGGAIIFPARRTFLRHDSSKNLHRKVADKWWLTRGR